VQHVIQLLDASQAAYLLKATDNFCFVWMLVSLETIVSALLGLAGTAVLILYCYSMSLLHYWKKTGVKSLKPLPLLGNTKTFALNNVHRLKYSCLLTLNWVLSGSQ
jgi:hypothetical protein